jgi:hypothetical protein
MKLFWKFWPLQKKRLLAHDKMPKPYCQDNEAKEPTESIGIDLQASYGLEGMTISRWIASSVDSPLPMNGRRRFQADATSCSLIANRTK